MGVVENVGYDIFPKQGHNLNKKVIVIFRYDSSKHLEGKIIRDDMEFPWVTIIKLNDERFILAGECMYSIID